MEGTIVRMPTDKQFAFVRDENKVEYFFHKSDFNGHWLDLIYDYNRNMKIGVTFDPVNSPKGPRAENVTRVDWPNTAV